MNKKVVAGIITGQVSGLIMAVVVMAVFMLFLGHSPLYPVQVIGSAVFGETALQGFHFGALIAGLLLHQLGPSLLWGLIFGLIAGKLNIKTAGSSIALGVAIGLVSMIDVYVLVPAIMTSLQGADIWNREVPIFWDWAAHLVFGLSFGLFPKFLKS
jgi:hypothetical protein